MQQEAPADEGADTGLLGAGGVDSTSSVECNAAFDDDMTTYFDLNQQTVMRLDLGAKFEIDKVCLVV